uniref:Uncharacterized protein n=1 Tax=Micrurus spixii TaxID=129469 RepID=A0A2D4NDT1_9SAUR
MVEKHWATLKKLKSILEGIGNPLSFNCQENLTAWSCHKLILIQQVYISFIYVFKLGVAFSLAIQSSAKPDFSFFCSIITKHLSYCQVHFLAEQCIAEIGQIWQTDSVPTTVKKCVTSL